MGVIEIPWKTTTMADPLTAAKTKRGTKMMKDSEIPVGSKIYFVLEKCPYRVRAKSTDGGFLICTKPFNLQHTVLYCIWDTKKQIRGTEGVIFCMGAETDQQCQEMIGRLERGETAVSYKNQVTAMITRVDLPKTKKEK